MSHATGNPKGRPSQLKDPARSAILTAIRCGSTYCDAAEAAGVSYETFRGWRQQGELDLKSGKKSAFSSFLVDFKKARAQFVTNGVRRIEKASAKSWQAYAWLLERRRQKTFALNSEKVRELLRKNADLEVKLDQILASLPGATPLPVPPPTPEA